MESDYSGREEGPDFRWFAWRPTRTQDRGWRWLRMVNRHRVQFFHDGWLKGSWWETSVAPFEHEPEPFSVDIEQRLGRPTTCKVYRNGRLVFTGVDYTAVLAYKHEYEQRPLAGDPAR